MRVACPECTQTVEAAPGTEVVCPACMTPFNAPESMTMPRRFDVLMPDGSTLTRQSAYAVRTAIYTGKIPITARLRADVGEGNLVPVYGYPMFGQVFTLLGVEPPASAGTRKIAGWQGVKKPRTAAAPRAAAGAAPRELELKPAKGAPILLIVGGMVAVFAVLVVVAALVYFS